MMSQDRLMKVLLAPVVSEKSTMVGEKHGQVVFRVVPDATKHAPASRTIPASLPDARPVRRRPR